MSARVTFRKEYVTPRGPHYMPVPPNRYFVAERAGIEGKRSKTMAGALKSLERAEASAVGAVQPSQVAQ